MAAIQSNGTGGGNWSAAASWDGGVVPGEGDTVQIVSGDTITIDTDITVGDDTSTPALDILDGGTLDWDNAGDDTLTLKGNFYIRNGGTLDLDGTADKTKTLSIKLNYSASPADGKYAFVWEDGAIISIQGAALSQYSTTLASSANSGQANLETTDDVSSDWQVGDKLVVVNTGSGSQRIRSEEKEIQSISGTTITLTTNLSYTHAAGGLILNLSRNIIISSYNSSYPGYIVHNNTTDGNIDIDYAEFSGLGTSTSSKSGIYTNGSTRTIDMKYSSLHGGEGKLLYFLKGIGTVDNCIFWTTSSINTMAQFDSQSSTFTISNSYFISTAVSNGCLTIYGTSKLDLHDCSFIGGIIGLDLQLVNNIEIYNNKYYGGYRGIRLTSTCFAIRDKNSEYGVGIGSQYNVQRDVSLEGTYYKQIKLEECNLNSPTKVYLQNTSIQGSRVNWWKSGSHKTWDVYGSYEKQSTVKYSGNYALLMNPTNASNELVAEATVFAKAGETVSYSCYMRKDVSMAVLPYIRLSGAGITTTTATMTDSVDTWELLTVSGVATEDGFCKIEFVCQNASGNVYVDDDQDSFAHWFEGDIPSVLPKPSLTANDIMNTVIKDSTYSEGTFGQTMRKFRRQTVRI